MSLGGTKYIVTFIDNYFKRCWMYLIKKKSDVFPIFKQYKTQVKLESGKMIKCLRIDNGGECTKNKKVRWYSRIVHDGIYSSTKKSDRADE